MSFTDKPRRLVRKSEEDQISRNVRTWLNTYPSFPDGVRSVNFVMLKEDTPSMSISTIPGTYITGSDIIGNYTAEYQFQLFYRAQPSDDNERLSMVETLNAIGDWAMDETNLSALSLGPGKRPTKIETSPRASFEGRFDNGDEDFQITMKLTYEVSV